MRRLRRARPGGHRTDIVLSDQTAWQVAALAAECTRNDVDVAVVELGSEPCPIFAARGGSELVGLTNRQVYCGCPRCPLQDRVHPQHRRALADNVDLGLAAQDIRFQLPMRGGGGAAQHWTRLCCKAGAAMSGVCRQVFDAQQRTPRAAWPRAYAPSAQVARAQSVKVLWTWVGTVGILSQDELSQAGGSLRPRDGRRCTDAQAIAEQVGHNIRLRKPAVCQARVASHAFSSLRRRVMRSSVSGKVVAGLSLVITLRMSEVQRAALATGDDSAGSATGLAQRDGSECTAHVCGARQPMPPA